MSNSLPSPRWITFDSETSCALQARIAPERIVEFSNQRPLEYVLERPSTVVAMLPASEPNQSALAIFRWNSAPLPANEPENPPHMQVAGFLGLTDELVFEDDPQEKKGWWRWG